MADGVVQPTGQKSKKCPRVDGHVLRVSGRHEASREDTGSASTDDGSIVAAVACQSAATDLLIIGTRLVVPTEVGVFIAPVDDPTSWKALGEDLPNAPVSGLTASLDGSAVIAATHGRGLWRIELP